MVKPKILKDVVIVAGHPRSGTSLACQLVESAGVKFPSDFEGDEYNKSGYYELAAALGSVLLVLIMVLYWIYDRLVGASNIKL